VPALTVNEYPALACPPTVTTTFPVVAPTGTGAVMLVALQLAGEAVVPLNVTVLPPCVAPKFVPVIVTEVPTAAGFGRIFVMSGAGGVTVNKCPLLACPPTVTTTFPVVAPTGTGAVMLVALQLAGEAVVPLKVTVLPPCVAPKFIPVIVTEVPTAAGFGRIFAMTGEPEEPVRMPTMGVTTGEAAPTNWVTVLSVAFETQTLPEPSIARRRERFSPAW
jgi:hypothetical protein